MKMINATKITADSNVLSPCKKKTPLFGALMEKNFYVDIPRKRIYGDPGDVLLIDANGKRKIIKAKTFEKNYQVGG